MTQNQRRFVEEYMKTGNATQAYKKVYKSCKNEATAKTNGSRLLTNANVRAYIEQLNQEAKTESILSIQEIQEIYTSIARNVNADPFARVKALDSLAKYRGITEAEKIKYSLEKKKLALEKKKLKDLDKNISNGAIKVVMSKELEEWGG